MATMSSVDAGPVLGPERSKGMAATSVVKIASGASVALAKETYRCHRIVRRHRTGWSGAGG
jgi:hypothetical protein